ncbi:MAG: hypothetical protein K6E47_03825 [Lachnospiraceae bacterium]|nr:hypothetical protein [Lachnospiraceae bacterium]
MNQITNSPIKEAMRQQNENDARNREVQIRNRLNSDIAQLVYKSKFPGSVCAGLVIGVGILIAVISQSMDGFLIGALIGVAIYIGLNVWVKKQNSGADAEKIRLQDQAEKDIQNAYAEADRRTVQQINAYDNEVKQYCQRILQKADTITTMIQHNTDMFQRMVSHADAGSNMRFVESDFTFKVIMTGVMYSYQSRYTNPQDDFNFDKQRFRNLNKETECEGLAQALAKLTIKKMMSLYPPNSLHITVSHIDAEVTMHYKAANKNFVAARDIF